MGWRLRADRPVAARPLGLLLGILPAMSGGDLSLYVGRSRSWGSRFIRPPNGERPRAVTACPAAMFRAAFTSALSAYPQATQWKNAWFSRLSAATCPHAEHCWLVYAG